MPKPWTTQSVLTALTEAANLTYGATIGAHAVAEAIHKPLLAAGVESTILNSIPMVGMGISALRIVFSIRDVISSSKGRREDAILTVIGNSSLFIYAYNCRSQIMTIGSTAFGHICLGFVMQALSDFTIALAHFLEVRKDRQKDVRYSEAFDNLVVSTLNLIGWGAIGFAHLSVVATAASPLLIVGAACLVAGALYAGGAALYRAYNIEAAETAEAAQGQKSPLRVVS